MTGAPWPLPGDTSLEQGPGGRWELCVGDREQAVQTKLLLMLCSDFRETLEEDQGSRLGAKTGDTDLDYEIVDRAGEHSTRRASAATHLPGAGPAEPRGETRTGSSGRQGRPLASLHGPGGEKQT